MLPKAEGAGDAEVAGREMGRAEDSIDGVYQAVSHIAARDIRRARWQARCATEDARLRQPAPDDSSHPPIFQPQS